MTVINSADAQQPDPAKVRSFSHQLDDVMEITDTNILKQKLAETEASYRSDSSEINKARLGIIYHETALNLGFFSKTEFKGYAQKSYDVLTELFNAPGTSKGLMPFIASYRASALSLTGAETKKLKLLGGAFTQFKSAAEKYAAASPLPEFLRGSVAENLPWFFFSKRKAAKHDFQSVIDKYEVNNEYADWKIMSFTYWARAKQVQSDKQRAVEYVNKAIELDPGYKAGRKRAEMLLKKLSK